MKLRIAIVLSAALGVMSLACGGPQYPDGNPAAAGKGGGTSEPFAGLRLNGTNATGMAGAPTYIRDGISGAGTSSDPISASASANAAPGSTAPNGLDNPSAAPTATTGGTTHDRTHTKTP